MSKKSLLEKWLGFDSRQSSIIRWRRAIETGKIRYKILSLEIKSLKDILRHKHENVKIISDLQRSVFAQALQQKRVQAKFCLKQIENSKVHLNDAKTEGKQFI